MTRLYLLAAYAGLNLLLTGCGSPGLWSDIDLNDFQAVSANIFELTEWNPRSPQAYVEQRYMWGMGEGILPTVRQTRGEKCAHASVPEDCRAAFDALATDQGLRPFCDGLCSYEYFAVNEGDINSTLDSLEDVSEFLGDIDTASEALALAYLSGYALNPVSKERGAIRERDGGYQVIATKHRSCDPIESTRYDLFVSRDATVTVLRSQVYESEDGCWMF